VRCSRIRSPSDAECGDLIDAQRRMLDFEIEDEGFQICGQSVQWSWGVWSAESANTALSEALDLAVGWCR
jgi:hypothetical protein